MVQAELPLIELDRLIVMDTVSVEKSYTSCVVKKPTLTRAPGHFLYCLVVGRVKALKLG